MGARPRLAAAASSSSTGAVASSSSSSGTVASSSSSEAASSSSTASGSSTSSGSSAMTGGTSGSSPLFSGESALLSALVQILQTGTSPAVLAAQQALLRRMVLEGDVIPSRIPAPKNISEVGGYLNLLGHLGETTMRSEVLASALGVAPPTGLLSSPVGHPLSMVAVINDRPSGNVQPSIPLNWYVRSDFYMGAKAALMALHANGAMLPLMATPAVLPAPSPTFTGLSDWLPLIGRELQVFPPAALANPATDPVAVAATISGGPYQIVCNATGPGAPAPAQWWALQYNAVGPGTTEIALPTAQFVPIAPELSTSAGFYPASPLPTPANVADTVWSTLKNLTGLIAGVTTLGAEIALLYSPNDVGASAIVPYLNYVWNGSTFVAQ